MNGGPALDLVILVSGADEREVLDELLSARRPSLRIRPIRFRIVKHPRRDPGCFQEAPQLLQPFQAQATHALVILDHEGSGQENRAADEVVADLRDRLARSGWGDRAEVLLLQPELEVWIWSDSPWVDRVLGWEGREPSLRQWLLRQGLWQASAAKPPRPKESLQAALRESTMRRSAAIYRELAAKVSLDRCSDTSFVRLQVILRNWFAHEV